VDIQRNLVIDIAADVVERIRHRGAVERDQHRLARAGVERVLERDREVRRVLGVVLVGVLRVDVDDATALRVVRARYTAVHYKL
jgi:hypothetical protein